MIDISESFEHLPKAPIVEAVIDLRAYTRSALEENPAREHLQNALVGYEFLDSRRSFRHTVEFGFQEGEQPNQILDDLGWQGLRFKSEDGQHIAQFNRDGFVFSRLAPYLSWDAMYAEAMRLWRIYEEFAQPLEINRVGLRYINRMQLPQGDLNFEDYIYGPPVSPCDLAFPFAAFSQHNSFVVPDHPYRLNITKMLQPSTESATEGLGLLLDLDVFTTNGFDLDDARLNHRLLEMRWLKNKAFSGSVTDKALALFR